MIIWLNGRFLDARSARISPLDRGLLHGDGVYDTWRTYDGHSFALPDHLQRLGASARALDLPGPGAVAPWEHRTRTLLRRNGLADATFRLTVTRGASGVGPVPDTTAPPLWLLTARPIPATLTAQQAAGVAVITLPFPRDIDPAWCHLKLIGHPSVYLGKKLAAERGAFEGLYVNSRKEVTEGTTANVALVEGGALVTPPLSAGILSGVTRALLLRLAHRLGLSVRESPISLQRLAGAPEVLLTSSTIEILPVIRLNGRRVGTGTAGATTRALQQAYRAAVMRAGRRR
jgi:branched-subunit amino acid aminotransferase/4-amino-4-deoxychorismate lyase